MTTPKPAHSEPAAMKSTSPMLARPERARTEENAGERQQADDDDADAQQLALREADP